MNSPARDRATSDEMMILVVGLLLIIVFVTAFGMGARLSDDSCSSSSTTESTP